MFGGDWRFCDIDAKVPNSNEFYKFEEGHEVRAMHRLISLVIFRPCCLIRDLLLPSDPPWPELVPYIIKITIQ